MSPRERILTRVSKDFPLKSSCNTSGRVSSRFVATSLNDSPIDILHKTLPHQKPQDAAELRKDWGSVIFEWSCHHLGQRSNLYSLWPPALEMEVRYHYRRTGQSR